MSNSKFSQQCCWQFNSFGMNVYVVWLEIHILTDHGVLIFKIKPTLKMKALESFIMSESALLHSIISLNTWIFTKHSLAYLHSECIIKPTKAPIKVSTQVYFYLTCALPTTQLFQNQILLILEQFSKANTSNTETASHVVTSMEPESKLFFSHYWSSHNFITHMHKIIPNVHFLVYPGSEQPKAAAVQCKWEVYHSVPAKWRWPAA